MGKFKSREEDFQALEKRKSKPRSLAAPELAGKGKKGSFFEDRKYLKKKFIFSLTFILLAFLFIFLPFLRTEKKVVTVAGLGSARPATEAAASTSASAVPSVAAVARAEKSAYNLEDLLPLARKIVVLVKSAHGSGSGFLLPQGGLVVTCARIVGKADDTEVYMASGAVKKAVVLKRLPLPVDVAFLQVEDFGIEGQPLADSERCQEGEEVVAVGVPGSDKWRPDLVLTRGKIVRCNRPYQGVQYFQIDRDIHPAAVGGPVLNTRGEILGMGRGELSGAGFEGARYALAVDMVKGLIDQRLAHLEKSIQEKEQFYKYVYDDLWVVLSAEHHAYQKRLSDLYEQGKLSFQEATRLDQKGSQSPEGHSSMKNWVSELTDKVIGGELTKMQASARIKAHFER